MKLETYEKDRTKTAKNFKLAGNNIYKYIITNDVKNGDTLMIEDE